MIRSDAEKLYFLVNDKEILSALNSYVEVRITFLKDALVTAPNMDEVLKLQGAIEELRRIRHLREEVNNPKD
jgi:hypothetical protein